MDAPSSPAAWTAALRGARVLRIEPPFGEGGWKEKALLLNDMLVSLLRETMERAAFVPEACAMASTTLSSAYVDQTDLRERLNAQLVAECGVPCSSIMTAYECAGWGFALRFFAKNTRVGRLAILLADVDLHDLEAVRAHPVIGRSGFTLAVLLLEIGEPRHAPVCAGPFRNSAFNEFLVAMRARVRLGGTDRIFVPYMRKEFSAPMERALAGCPLSSNLNDELGHCFGADPWIGIVRSAQATDRTVTVGSVGFKGYYTLADVHVPADAFLAYGELVRPSADDLRRRA